MREYQISWLMFSMLPFKTYGMTGWCPLPLLDSLHTACIRLMVDLLNASASMLRIMLHLDISC